MVYDINKSSEFDEYLCDGLKLVNDPSDEDSAFIWRLVLPNDDWLPVNPLAALIFILKVQELGKYPEYTMSESQDADTPGLVLYTLNKVAK